MSTASSPLYRGGNRIRSGGSFLLRVKGIYIEDTRCCYSNRRQAAALTNGGASQIAGLVSGVSLIWTSEMVPVKIFMLLFSSFFSSADKKSGFGSRYLCLAESVTVDGAFLVSYVRVDSGKFWFPNIVVDLHSLDSTFTIGMTVLSPSVKTLVYCKFRMSALQNNRGDISSLEIAGSHIKSVLGKCIA